jgi:ubiquinol oxidase
VTQTDPTQKPQSRIALSRRPVRYAEGSWDGTAEEAELMSELRDRLAELELSNEGIWDRERARPEVPAPWLIKVPYYVLCYFLDAVYPENRPIQRFWFLETVARMPYFSYNTMLTLYELLGWWRRSSELRRVHFAEEWNEYHHLLIHESLGGDRMWRDRFLAQHSALLYYAVLLALWLVSPALAYNFSELIEAHAVDTYAQFAEQNKDALRLLPAPRIAKAYYENSDLYLFDEFQTARPRSSRRPQIRTLYDTFIAIRDDEGEHVATMKECQMDDSMMANVAKVNLGTAAVIFFIGANLWLQRVAGSAGFDALEMDGVDAGEMLGEDGLIAVLFRLFPFLPFL